MKVFYMTYRFRRTHKAHNIVMGLNIPVSNKMALQIKVLQKLPSEVFTGSRCSGKLQRAAVNEVGTGEKINQNHKTPIKKNLFSLTNLVLYTKISHKLNLLSGI